MIKTEKTYTATIYIAGDLHDAKSCIRRFCMEGLCVTVTPTTFIYTAGAEEGVAVGLQQQLSDLQQRVSNQEQWVASAMDDYRHLKEWLNGHGVTQWQDTVDAVIALTESFQQRAT